MRSSRFRIVAPLLATALSLLAPSAARPQQPPAEATATQAVELEADRTPSIKAAGSCLLKGGTVITVTKGVISPGDVLIVNGKISAIGAHIAAPAGVPVIDCAGRFVTPGIVDAHSHIGMDAVNEGSDSITAEVRMTDVIDPDAMSFYRALSNGVTSALLLHGSANAIGGQSVVVKLKWKHPVNEIVIPDAPRMIKFALGENVKRSNGGGGGAGTARFPTTRMGVEAVYRRAFEAARNYMQAWTKYNAERTSNPGAVPPRRDLRLETLAGILRGEIHVQCHSYRADEMEMMLRLSQEFHFNLTLQHALEAYKILPEIVAAHAGVSTFADAWAYKVEANDATPYNAALCTRAGIVTSVNSDNQAGTDRLNIEAANCIKYGGLTDTEALRLVTINPAMQLGIDKRTGSIEQGKDGDVTVWSGYPLSVYSKCDLTIVEGETLYQRRDPFHLDGAATVLKVAPKPAPAPSAAQLRAQQETCVPAVLPDAQAYVITGATVHPVSGPDIDDGTVVISGGKILAVGKHPAIPKGAIVLRAAGMHVYPGLIDSGSIIGLSEIDAVNAGVDSGEAGDFEPDLRAVTALNPGSEHFAIARNNGITAAAVTPQSAGISGQIGLINLAGWTPALMTVGATVALHVELPEPARAGGRFGAFAQPDQLLQVRERAAQRLKLIADDFDRAKTYAAARAAGLSAKDPELEALIPYVTGKSPVVFSVNTAAGVKQAIKFAEDHGLRAILAGGPDAWKVADLIAKKKVPYIYTIPVNNSIEESVPTDDYDPVDTVWSAPAVLQRAGVTLCFQTKSASEVKNLPRQVGIMCAYGLSHEAALRALTLNAANLFGAADKMGSLEAGKLANVVVTDGDILEARTHVCDLFIDGKPIKLESKHTQLNDLYSRRLKEIRR